MQFSKEVMKKDDKQPDKPKKKPQKKAAGKSSAKKPKQQADQPIEIILPAQPKRILNLDATKYRDSLTVEQWQELSKKDPSLLTPTQAKQLAEANEQFAAIAKRLSEMYDFRGVAAMFKAIDTMPFARAMQQAQETALVVSKFQSSLILPTIPTQQLVAFQQSLAVSTSLVSQSLIAATNASNILRNFFIDWQIINERLVKALSVDIGSIADSLLRITPTEFIDVDVIDIIDRDGNVAIVSDTSRTKRINDDYQLISTAKLDLLFTELKVTRSELAEIKNLVSNKLPSGLTKIALTDARFRYDSSLFVLKGYEVEVQRSSKQAKFVDFFISSLDNFIKKWDVTEFMTEAFGMRLDIDGSETKFNSIIKGYVTALNVKIAAATKGQIVEFFILLDYQVYINPDHISNL